MFGYFNLSSVISLIFVLVTLALLLLAIFILINWIWHGGGGILFPGFGLIVSTPAFVVFLLFLSIVTVIIAGIFKTENPQSYVSESRKDFEYPNDIFSGCGNGTLDLSLKKNPDKYDEKTDRTLKICINEDDLTAIQDLVIPGRIDFTNSMSEKEFNEAREKNMGLFRQFASQYPMLGRIDDMYQDYIFTPEDVKELREECIKLKSKNQTKKSDLALRKFIYACDEALKDYFYLVFYCD